MKHTEIFDRYPDIITIRHGEDVEITEAHMLENLTRIRQLYPDKKRLLVEHVHSYSLSFGAMQFLQEIEYFVRMASVVSNMGMIDHINRSLGWVEFRVPFRVFSDLELALKFLRES